MRSIGYIWALGALCLATATSAPAQPTPADLEGERLEFVIRWGVIPAGRATLEVEAEDAGRLLLRATARSLDWIDWIYPVRDLIESTVRAADLTPDFYFKSAKEGRGKAKVEEVRFDRQAGLAHYQRDGSPRDPLKVPPEVLDPLSAFYFFRTLDLDGDRVELQITDGKKLITGEILVVGREEIKTPAGRFRTLKIEPRIEGIGGVFERSPGARIFIWLSDDEWRRPVRMRSKVAVGHFTVELTAAREPASETDDRPENPKTESAF